MFGQEKVFPCLGLDYALHFPWFKIPCEERGKRLNSSRENEEISRNLRPNFLSKMSP